MLRNQSKQSKKSRRKGKAGERFVQMEKSVRDVQRFKVWRDVPPPFVRHPRGPYPGALMTTRQAVLGSFTQNTNVANISGQGNYIVQTSSTPVLGQLSFCLADINQVTTFSSLFDRYRIEEVHIRFSTQNYAPSVFGVASPNNLVPQLYLAIDRDDSSAPASIAALTEYDNCVISPATNSVDIKLIPSVVSTIANASSTATSSVIRRSDQEWLDIAATTIPHFGVKWGIPALPVSTTSRWQWDIQCWYIISFKNPR